MNGLDLLAAHPLLLEADATAAEAHARAGQVYAGQPYIVHPRAVAKRLAEYLDDVEILAAALLHDTLEDTDLDKSHLVAQFGHRVAQMVDDVTSKAPRDLSRRERVQREAARLATVAPDSKSLKCADVIENLAGVRQLNLRFATVYVPEKRIISTNLVGAHPELYRDLLAALELAEGYLVAAPAAIKRRAPRP